MAPLAKAAVVLVNDQFIDGGFTNGTDALDLNWQLYTPGSPPNVTTRSIQSDSTTGLNQGVPDDAIQLSVSNQGFRGITGLLGSSVTLANGDALELSYDLRSVNIANGATVAPGNQAAAFRYGLYNTNTNITSYTDDFGYLARVSTGTNNTVDGGQEVGLGLSDAPLGGTDVSLISGSGSGFTGLTGPSVKLGLKITRSGADLTFNIKQNGTTVYTFIDSTSPFYTFNEIFVGTGTYTTNYRIDNISLVYTPIPEPATAGLASAAMGAMLLRRRRRTC